MASGEVLSPESLALCTTTRLAFGAHSVLVRGGRVSRRGRQWVDVLLPARATAPGTARSLLAPHPTPVLRSRAPITSQSRNSLLAFCLAESGFSRQVKVPDGSAIAVWHIGAVSGSSGAPAGFVVCPVNWGTWSFFCLLLSFLCQILGPRSLHPRSERWGNHFCLKPFTDYAIRILPCTHAHAHASVHTHTVN